MNTQGKAESGSGAGKVFLILGIGCLVLAGLACGIGYYVAVKAKSLGADVTRAALVQVINDTKLPAEQKTGVIGHIDRVTKAFKEGELSLEEVLEIFKELGDGPTLPAGVLHYVHMGYIGKSGLDPEERVAALRISQRYARGAIEGKISKGTTNTIMKMVQVTKRSPRGTTQTKLKESLTDEEFAAFHKAIADAVTTANIPDEPYQIDIAGEIGTVVDKALKK